MCSFAPHHVGDRRHMEAYVHVLLLNTLAISMLWERCTWYCTMYVYKTLHYCTPCMTYMCCICDSNPCHLSHLSSPISSVAQWQSTPLESRVLWVRVPPEAAHYSLKKSYLGCYCVVYCVVLFDVSYIVLAYIVHNI